jgi:hypothetical protein
VKTLAKAAFFKGRPNLSKVPAQRLLELVSSTSSSRRKARHSSKGKDYDRAD